MSPLRGGSQADACPTQAGAALGSRSPGVRELWVAATGSLLAGGRATAADVLDAQLRRALALHPDLVTLSIGPNDITRDRDVQQYERDVERA